MHAVDGISGGTITGDGVNDMLAERFGKYLPFFKKKMSETIELSNVSTLVDSTMAFNLNTIQ